jgi:hypothetical protein
MNRTLALNTVNSWAEGLRELFATNIKPIELLTFVLRKGAAERLVAGTATATDNFFMNNLVASRGVSGETVSSFCQAVMQDAQTMMYIVAVIDGFKKRCSDSLKNCADEEVAAKFEIARNDMNSIRDIILGNQG